VSLNADLIPNEHYGFDIGYAYSDVYTATNICFLGTAASPQYRAPRRPPARLARLRLPAGDRGLYIWSG
jgi:hypothetical protein